MRKALWLHGLCCGYTDGDTDDVVGYTDDVVGYTNRVASYRADVVGYTPLVRGCHKLHTSRNRSHWSCHTVATPHSCQRNK